MTAIRARRRTFTWVGFVTGLIGVAAVGGLGYAGVENLYDSSAGRRVAADEPAAPVQRLPYTPTALVATADEDGWLTTVSVLALAAGGVGGSIVSLSPSGDAASGNADSLAPLNAVYLVDGADELLLAGEGLTGMSFDVAEVLDAARFADLTTPLGELTVELPTELRDASTGESYPAGVTPMSPDQAGTAITSRDPSIDDWLLDPARASIWGAVAEAVGGGVGATSDDPPDTVPASLDEFVARLFAGPVEHRSFAFKEISSERVAEQLGDEYAAAFAEHDDTTVSVVAHDRAELVMVLAAIAPERMGAPFEGPTARVVSRFDSDDLAPLGLNNADVARQAINRLLFAKVNVVSFGQTDATPERTLIEVRDDADIAGVEAAFGTLFGVADVRVADRLIAGVELQITLGRAYLDTVDAP